MHEHTLIITNDPSHSHLCKMLHQQAVDEEITPADPRERADLFRQQLTAKGISQAPRSGGWIVPDE